MQLFVELYFIEKDYSYVSLLTCSSLIDDLRISGQKKCPPCSNYAADVLNFISILVRVFTLMCRFSSITSTFPR